jgi:hypothetical protein
LASPGSNPGGLADIAPPSGTTMDNFALETPTSSIRGFKADTLELHHAQADEWFKDIMPKGHLEAKKPYGQLIIN